MNEEEKICEKAWNEIIADGFRDNPIFKDVLRELIKPKDFAGYQWRCVEEALMARRVFNETKMRILTKTDKNEVSDKQNFARALIHLEPAKTVRAITQGCDASYPKIRRNIGIAENTKYLLNEMLPTRADKEYASFDNNILLTDTPDKYSFVSTDANIAGVQDGRIKAGQDGTCIILKQNKIDSTDRKYYKVRVKGGLIYDDSNSYELFTVGGVEFKMIHVEGGTFTMGAMPEMKNPGDDEMPTHQVTLSSYYIGETPVTQALWKAVMVNNPSFFKGDDLPVEQVSWGICQEFITALNRQLKDKLQTTGMRFRLPTEAEWEYAARGGNKSGGHRYSGSDKVDEVAWFEGNSDEETHPVGRKKANELDIYDMSGNVWEWCQDRYGENYYKESPQRNPTGPESGFYYVHRGGGWINDAWYCRLSCRDYTDYANFNLGFRLALSE